MRQTTSCVKRTHAPADGDGLLRGGAGRVDVGAKVHKAAAQLLAYVERIASHRRTESVAFSFPPRLRWVFCSFGQIEQDPSTYIHML